MALQAVTTYSQFDPYSFQDRIAPYLLVDKAAGEVMDTIDELGSKAETLKKYADENPNSDYAKQYNQYMKDLDQIASDMSKYGMSATLRNNSRGLKRKYSSVVSPMEEADKLFREQQKERLAHPERIYLKGLSFNDAYNNDIDNTYLTENDITKETILNYSSGFNTSYSKWIDQGATPDQAIVRARQENANTLSPMLNSLTQAGYDINDARIQKAIQTGIRGSETDAAKGEVMTRAQREANKLSRQQLNVSISQHKANMYSKGLNEDGSINYDKDNPYWRTKGFMLKEDSNGKSWVIDPNSKKAQKEAEEQVTFFDGSIGWKNGAWVTDTDKLKTFKPSGSAANITQSGNKITIKSKNKVVAEVTVGTDGGVVIDNKDSKSYSDKTIEELSFWYLNQYDQNKNTAQNIDILLGKDDFFVTSRKRGKSNKNTGETADPASYEGI